MQTLTVHDVDDRLVETLKRRAADHGRSVEAEHREVLQAALNQNELAERRVSDAELQVVPDRTELMRRLREFRDTQGDRIQTPSEVLIREGRDER